MFGLQEHLDQTFGHLEVLIWKESCKEEDVSGVFLCILTSGVLTIFFEQFQPCPVNKVHFLVFNRHEGTVSD